MDEKIKSTLRKTRSYEAESHYLRMRLDDARCKSNIKITERLKYVEGQLSCIHSWLALLSEDEAHVIKRHLVDDIDLPRVAVEYKERWGDEYSKTERTLKRYQRDALRKIVSFELAKIEFEETKE